MDDPEAGNRTGVWFWAMISNLGLECMSDDDFDELYVEEHIQHFLDRQYSYQGGGGLFLCPESRLWICAGWRSGHS